MSKEYDFKAKHTNKKRKLTTNDAECRYVCPVCGKNMQNKASTIRKHELSKYHLD